MSRNPQPPASPAMSRSEREDLQRLLRQREKVLKSAARQRSAELLSDFKNQLGQEYSFDQDEIWAKAQQAAEREVAKAQAAVAARCKALGIPERFAPSLSLEWHHRGYDNQVAARRAELLSMASSKIDAIEAAAFTQIELSCLGAQTQLAVAGLTSEAARQFIEDIPPIETLMPKLAFSEIAGEADPPVAEQLVSSNAIRQRRWRERQALLRNGGASRNGSGDGDGGVS
jgi:hypothetical protein